MAVSAADLARKCENVATTLPRANREAIGAASINIKTGWFSIFGAHGIVPGKKLRGVGKSGATWNVRFDIKGTANPTSLIRVTGPVHLVLSPTKPHMIVPRKSVRGKGAKAGRAALGSAISAGKVRGAAGGSLPAGALGQKRSAIVIGGNPRAYASHPGTTGKPDIWSECKAYAVKVGPSTFHAAIPGALTRAGFGH